MRARNSDDATPLPDVGVETSGAGTPRSPLPKHDPVSHPLHYTAGRIECIDAIESATADLVGDEAFCTGSAIKYLWRWKRKNGLEDLKKARWYLDRLINAVDAQRGGAKGGLR
jgi:hypothetical protein